MLESYAESLAALIKVGAFFKSCKSCHPVYAAVCFNPSLSPGPGPKHVTPLG
jgi:hypothetical protein